jgi:hypothetical protein
MGEISQHFGHPSSALTNCTKQYTADRRVFLSGQVNFAAFGLVEFWRD